MRRDAIEARRAAAEEWRQGGGVMTENQDPSPDPAVVVYIGRGFAGEAAP